MVLFSIHPIQLILIRCSMIISSSSRSSSSTLRTSRHGNNINGTSFDEFIGHDVIKDHGDTVLIGWLLVSQEKTFEERERKRGERGEHTKP